MQRVKKNWSEEEVNFLLSNWGSKSIPCIAEKLDRTVNSILNKKGKLELGAFLESGEYVTVNQFFKAIGRNGCWTYTLNQWKDKGFPVKTKKVKNNSFKVIYINDFWEWADKHRMLINFAKFEKNILGKEPEWVYWQRRADIEFAKYKVTPWTKEEDEKFISLLKLYKYTYRDLSIELRRTEGGIKRRITELSLTMWPLREHPHGVWTDEQIATVIDMYNKGYRSAVIKEYINKSEQAINGKIERLVADGLLEKR